MSCGTEVKEKESLSDCPPPSSLLLLSVTATHKPFWCVRSSPPPLTSVSVDTVANGKAGPFIYVSGVHGLNKSAIYFYYLFVEVCINGTGSDFPRWNFNLVPWRSSSRILQLLSSAEQRGPHCQWMEMFQADWVMRCKRGQHSKGATNWIMTHEGQIWAGDLASKVTPGSRSVLHSRLIILSLQSGTPALTGPHMHAHTYEHVHLSFSGLSLFALLTNEGVVLIDWIRRRKQWHWAPSPLYSPTFHSFESGLTDVQVTVADLSCDYMVTSFTWLHSYTTGF